MIAASHLHAMLIHFPIALLFAGFLAELISLFSKKDFFKQAALYLLVLGALGTIASYFSGNAAGDGMDEGSLQQPMELHEQAATITMWLAIITAALRVWMSVPRYAKPWGKWVGLVLFTVLIGAVARTGYLGGQLVYKHAAGVEIALPDFNAPEKE